MHSADHQDYSCLESAFDSTHFLADTLHADATSHAHDASGAKKVIEINRRVS